jgi:hypothetical protein
MQEQSLFDNLAGTFRKDAELLHNVLANPGLAIEGYFVFSLTFSLGSIMNTYAKSQFSRLILDLIYEALYRKIALADEHKLDLQNINN